MVAGSPAAWREATETSGRARREHGEVAVQLVRAVDDPIDRVFAHRKSGTVAYWNHTVQAAGCEMAPVVAWITRTVSSGQPSDVMYAEAGLSRLNVLWPTDGWELVGAMDHSTAAESVTSYCIRKDVALWGTPSTQK